MGARDQVLPHPPVGHYVVALKTPDAEVMGHPARHPASTLQNRQCHERQHAEGGGVRRPLLLRRELSARPWTQTQTQTRGHTFETTGRTRTGTRYAVAVLAFDVRVEGGNAGHAGGRGPGIWRERAMFSAKPRQPGQQHRSVCPAAKPAGGYLRRLPSGFTVSPSLFFEDYEVSLTKTGLRKRLRYMCSK